MITGLTKYILWTMLLMLPLYAKTTVGGNISSNTTWSDTVIVTSDVNVLNNVTLTVEPGTHVLFNGDQSLNIQGRILAEGTDTSGIVFKRRYTDQEWFGIVFDNTPETNDSSKFVYCSVQGCFKRFDMLNDFRGAFLVRNFSKVLISQCNISNNNSWWRGSAIILDTSDAVITYNSFNSNDMRDDEGSYSGPGGVIYCNESNADISNNTISNNEGSGIYCVGNSNPTIIKNDIVHNTVYYESEGGGIYVKDGSYIIIRGNLVQNNYSPVGGGIYCDSSDSLLIEKNTVKDNYNSSGGAGIYINNGSDIVVSGNEINSNDNSNGISCINSQGRIIGNNVLLNGEQGIYINNSEFLVSDNQIYSNCVDSDGYSKPCNGGGIYVNSSSVNTIKNNLIDKNSGGIYAIGNHKIIQNIISHSDAYNQGGAIYTSGDASIINNTIVNNSAADATAYSGGLYINGSASVINNIIWGNSLDETDSSQIYLTSNATETSFYNCDIQGGLSTLGGPGAADYNENFFQDNIDTDPYFVNPSNNLSADWSLQEISPCINAGTPDTSGLNIGLLDFAGNPRIFDGETGIIDIGIYEYQENKKIQSPYFNPPPGNFSVPQLINILSNTDSVQIYYTTNGDTPDMMSQIYSEPIAVDSNMTIKAIAYKQGFLESDIVSGSYIIEDQVINIDIQFQKEWFDTNYDGYASNIINAENTTISYGSIISYTWVLGNDTIGSGANTNITLATGTQKLILAVKTNRGLLQKDSAEISVYSSFLQTSGKIYSSVAQTENNTILISSEDDKIYSFDSTGTVDWTFITGGDIRSTIAIRNNNHIYVGSTDTRLYSLDYLGNPNWDKAMGGVIQSSPSIGPDGTIYTGITTGRLSAISESGDFLWSVQTGGAIISSPAVSSNGNIYFGSTDGKLYAVSPSGDTLWTYLTGDSITSSPALGIDSSIVFGSFDGYVYKLKEDGSLAWKFDTQSKIKSSPVIGIFGRIFIGTDSGNFYSLGSTGTEIWMYNAVSPIESTPSIGPGGRIYFGCNDGRFIALSGNGEFKWQLKTNGPITAAPLILNNNLIYIGSIDNKVYIMKDASNASTKEVAPFTYEWPTFKGNNQRTGYLGDVINNISEYSPKVPKDFSLSQNYPNPFNPETTIKYQLPEASNVTLNIYNMNGQIVTSLVNKKQSAGYYQVAWDATNYSSGVYFYRLETNTGFTQTKKLILLK